MLLDDGTIEKWLKAGLLHITPFEPSSLQPASYDCTLSDEFLRIDDVNAEIIKMREDIPYVKIKAKNGKVVIPAKSFVLAGTREYIKLPNFVTGFVEGRSSIGRLGLFVQNAGLIDAGFEGNITLELFNANELPIELEVGCRICQLVFFEMNSSAKNPYKGKYQNQKGTTGTLIKLDREFNL